MPLEDLLDLGCAAYLANVGSQHLEDFLPSNTRTFRATRLTPRALKRIFESFVEVCNEQYQVKLVEYGEKKSSWGDGPPRYSWSAMQIERPDDIWRYDNERETFLAEIGRDTSPFSVTFDSYDAPEDIFDSIAYTVEISCWSTITQVEVTMPERDDVLKVMRTVTEQAEECLLDLPPVSPNIFIGHGGTSSDWRGVKDHLQDQHKYVVEAYETGSRTGRTIQDIVTSMAESNNFAILVMTAEDEQANGQMRARQNVVHETGLFQGKLGFERAIVLLEDGVENYSNLAGVQYIGFAKGHIRETYGDVLAALRREFPRV